MNDPLTTARAAERDAADKLRAAESALAQARETAEREQHAVDHAIAAELSATLNSAPELRHKRIACEARRDVAQRYFHIAQTAHGEATAAVANTQAALNAAARETLHAEIRREFAALEQARRDVETRRERLLGAYLLLRENTYFAAPTGALTEEQWESLDTYAPTAAAMDIGLPLIGRAMGDPDLFGPDPRAARGRVDAYIHVWRRRLAEIERAS